MSEKTLFIEIALNNSWYLLKPYIQIICVFKLVKKSLYSLPHYTFFAISTYIVYLCVLHVYLKNRNSFQINNTRIWEKKNTQFNKQNLWKLGNLRFFPSRLHLIRANVYLCKSESVWWFVSYGTCDWLYSSRFQCFLHNY